MSYQFLQLEQQGQVAYVWLNCPELHNALIRQSLKNYMLALSKLIHVMTFVLWF